MRNNKKTTRPKFENWDRCTECLEITKELRNNVMINGEQVVGEYEYLCNECYAKRKIDFDI